MGHRHEGGVVKGTLFAEFGQSMFLLGLMATMVGAYVGLGLLAIRVLG